MRRALTILMLTALLCQGAHASDRSGVPGAPGAPVARDASVRVGPSGLPVPRFVALKKDEVRGRFGPGFDYPVAAVYRKRGLPVRVIAETRDDAWRRVEDADGQRLWIHRSMLMSAESALVESDDAVLRAKPDAAARGRARLAQGVLAEVLTCQSGWCRLKAGEFKGWLPASALWGVDRS